MHWGMNGNKLFSSTDYSATSSQSHTGSHSLNSCPWMLLVYNWKECLAKINILTLFIHPHVVPCAVICFVEHKRTNSCWELLFNKQTNKFNWVCIESFCSGSAGLNLISYTHWSLDSRDFSVSPALYSEWTKSKWFTHDNTIIRLGDLPLHLLIKQFQLARVSDDCVFFYPILDTFEPYCLGLTNGICWLWHVGI